MSDSDKTPPSARQDSRHRGPRGQERGARRGGGVFSSTISDIQRLREIASVLARHGFVGMLRRAGLENIPGLRLELPEEDPTQEEDGGSTARRIRLVLQDLGATFIKLGQVLSTRHDLLPQVYLEELEKLQDQVTPEPFSAIRVQIEEGLGAPLESLFSQVEPEPLAVASIGQVHAATTLDGQRVVIKVQRPGIASRVRSDLDLLYFLSRLLEATTEEGQVYNLGELVREFDRAIHQELDFLHEARNVRRFGQQYAQFPAVVVPAVLDSLSSRTVLTLEYLEGQRLNTVIPGSQRAQELVDILLELAYLQIFVNGLFHADPHPGNLLVLEDGRVGLLDLGLVGRLSKAQQDDLITLLIAVLYGDVDGMARALLRMGHARGRINLAAFKREIARLRDEYLTRHLGDIDIGAFTSDLMDAALRFQIRLNNEYALLVKAVVTVEGVLRRLHPGLDLVEAATPMAKQLLRERYSSQRLMQEAFQGANTLSGFLRDVPAQMDQILMDIESGTVAIHVEHEQLASLGGHLKQLGTRLFLGLVCCGLIIGGAVMLAQLDYRPRRIPVLLFVALGFFGGASLTALSALAWPWLRDKARRVRLARLLPTLRRWIR